MLRWVLAAAAFVYGVSLLVMRDRWRAFFGRIDSREREIPSWFPVVLGVGAVALSLAILVVL
jgi:hypothetical protein